MGGNPLEPELLDSYYKKMSKYESEEIVGKSDASKVKMIERQYDFITNTIKDFESIIDIGASTGESLNKYKLKGKNVAGIEPSKNCVQWAKKAYDIDLYNMTFNEWYMINKSERYDLVFLSHVLEHNLDFNDMIKK